ncbi:MAG: M36 family metallopeptidase [Bacteroidia bacterium]
MRIIYTLVLVLAFSTLHAQVPQQKALPELLNTIDNSILKSGNFQLTSSFTDKHNGVSHAYGHQTHNGVQVEKAVFDAHAQKGKIVSFHNSFYPSSKFRSVEGHALSQNQVVEKFINKNMIHFNIAATANLNFIEYAKNEFVANDPLLSAEDIKIKKTYMVVNNNAVPTWSLSFLLPDESHWFYTVINAQTGETVWQLDYMLECDFDHDHSSHDFSPSPNNEFGNTANKRNSTAAYFAYPFGTESPNHGPRELLKNANDSLASPFGWHDVDGFEGAEYTITRGNNVWAYEDVDGSNATEGRSPDGGTELYFDYPFDEDSSHAHNQDAAITNLFVWNNYMHDFLYQYGFDEESGNFQESNYGRHATGEGDFVHAHAQDGGGTNNANFATPPDGSNPRMQMYLWGVGASGATLQVFDPSDSKGSYSVFGANFGDALSEKPIKGKLVMVDDGTGTSTLGCEDLVNASEIDGNIALIERGTCLFVDKVRNAQDAGAIAVIIFTDNRPAQTIFGTNAGDITIPSIMIDRTLGLALMDEIESEDIEVSMYTRAATGGYDGDFDNGVIAHEYGHGISIRLTGGALNSGCLSNVEQMGEGWSDFFALVTTHHKDDKATDLRGIGTYVRGQATNGAGIRPYPYSVDQSRSEYDYEDIAVLSVPHGIGSVWCAMLWDMYWNFIDKYGFDEDLYTGTGGNNIAIQLVVDGMKLQPCNPGFEAARDAILLADELNNGGENQKIIWQAFGGRGLGWDADGGDPDDRNDGRNGFEIPPKYRGIISLEKTAVDRINEEDELVYNVAWENESGQTYYNVVVVDTIPEMLELVTSSLDCDWDVNGNILSMTLDSMPAGTSFECSYTTLIKPDLHSKIFAEDGAESDVDWSVVMESGSNPWRIQSAIVAEGSFAWYVDNVDYESEGSLVYEVGVVEDGAILSFQHYYNTSFRRDGGVVEISADGGATWNDAGPYFVENGYSGNIAVSQPLRSRDAFTGSSSTFIRSQIDLFEFAGQSIQVRFRFATDRVTGGEGWYVDDLQVVRFSGVTNTIWAEQDDNVSTVSVNTLILETDGQGNSINNVEVTLGAKVFPNPAVNETVISIPAQIVGSNISITDVNGKEVLNGKLLESKNVIDLSDLSNGTYIINIMHNGVSEKHQIVKQ